MSRSIKIVRTLEQVFEPRHHTMFNESGEKEKRPPSYCCCEERKNTENVKKFVGGDG
jgi:hypothetical protein